LAIKIQQKEKQLAQTVGHPDDARAKLLASQIHASNVRAAGHAEAVERDEHMMTSLEAAKQSIHTAKTVSACSDIVAVVHGTSDLFKISKNIAQFQSNMETLQKAQDITHDAIKAINDDKNVSETPDDIVDRATKTAELAVVGQMPTVTPDAFEDDMDRRLRALSSKVP
jgi:hypothetical protein